MTQFRRILEVLCAGKVRFVVIGGVAAALHGSSYSTKDFDFVYERTPENLDRVVRSLAPHSPYLRGAPRGLPFRWDAETLRKGLNFTLITALGDIDLLGEMTGGGGYEELVLHSVTMNVFGLDVLVLDLPTLIKAKKAAGRNKDLAHVAALELILELKAGRRPPHPMGDLEAGEE